MYTCCSGTSAAHTYGNMTSIIKQFVKGLYPDKYFETEFISSSIGYTQFKPLRQKNREFLKKKKPIIIIKPRIEANDDDKFLYGTLLTERMYDNANAGDFGNLMPFFEDEEKGIAIKFMMDRMKIMFDVVVVYESAIEQINMTNYLKFRIRQNHNFMLGEFLESYIPKSVLELLSEQTNIPMYENDSVTNFLNYLNGHSKFPITYKLQDSTGNDEFFRFYRTNVDTVITGLDTDDGNKRGQVFDTFTTTFTITTEFWGTGFYYIFSKKPIPVRYEGAPKISDTGHVIPLFTIPVYSLKAPEGWNVHASTFYKVDAGVKEDITNFKSITTIALQAAIQYHRKNNIPLNILVKESIMMDEQLLMPGRDYEISYDSFDVVTKVIDPTRTYRLVIFINTLYINELSKKLFELKEI